MFRVVHRTMKTGSLSKQVPTDVFCPCIPVISFITISPMIMMCSCVCLRACLLSHVQLFAIPWTVVRQAPLSMGFPRHAGVTISSSRGCSWLRDQTSVSCISRQVLYHWATREAYVFLKLLLSLALDLKPVSSMFWFNKHSLSVLFSGSPPAPSKTPSTLQIPKSEANPIHAPLFLPF